VTILMCTHRKENKGPFSLKKYAFLQTHLSKLGGAALHRLYIEIKYCKDESAIVPLGTIT